MTPIRFPARSGAKRKNEGNAGRGRSHWFWRHAQCCFLSRWHNYPTYLVLLSKHPLPVSHRQKFAFLKGEMSRWKKIETIDWRKKEHLCNHCSHVHVLAENISYIIKKTLLLLLEFVQFAMKSKYLLFLRVFPHFRLFLTSQTSELNNSTKALLLVKHRITKLNSKFQMACNLSLTFLAFWY